MTARSENRRTYRRSILVWIALMILLMLSFGSAYIKLGAWNSVINLAIAAMKALLVAAFFMHLRNSPALLRIVAATGLLMLALLLGLSHTDYATRVMHRAPWQTPPQSQDGSIKS
jgi:cytochrome c oxidase subunit 4